jgi:hypothetical protein
MIPIYPETIVYIACPGNFATGGTELMHQLAYKLKINNITSKIYYYSHKNNANPTPPEYDIYEPDYTYKIEDKEKNLLIVPEIKAGMVYNYHAIRPVIWWLSVDNYLRNTYCSQASWPRKIRLLLQRNRFFIDRQPRKKIFHLYQSEYARQFLLKKNINEKNIYPLSDYLNPIFIQQAQSNKKSSRKNVILYNPKKGYAFTKKVMEYAPELTWIPLENKKPCEIAQLCSESKLYVDFGGHPGKDRLPREATINKCIILTSRNGSAAYYEDIPIPEQYKFATAVKNIPQIVSVIKSILNDYDKFIIDFNCYRDDIVKQESMFERNITRIFIHECDNKEKN